MPLGHGLIAGPAILQRYLNPGCDAAQSPEIGAKHGRGSFWPIRRAHGRISRTAILTGISIPADTRRENLAIPSDQYAPCRVKTTKNVLQMILMSSQFDHFST